jgi:hypothetical protein
MTKDEWIQAFAQEIGLAAPTPEQIDAILELASTAAHASERSAAPVAAWLAGAGGGSLQDINESARKVSGGGGE